MKYWTGRNITAKKILNTKRVFVFGSNPEGRHGLGAAKTAMSMGAKYGIGRGLQGNTYALPTKNISKHLPYVERATGIVYTKTGACSISLQQIKANLEELCEVAKNNKERAFIVSYQNSKKTLSGYSPSDIIKQLKSIPYVPSNIIIHESFKELWEGV